jgi:hypothetical protein
MTLPNTYILDKETIKLNAYRLISLFYANKEIARLSDPEERSDVASCLEKTFFTREMTQVLLSIAIGFRVLDDQMKALPRTDPRRNDYFQTLDKVNHQIKCMMFDEMPLREVCNKVIHASIVEPQFTEASESHAIDEVNWYGWSEAEDREPGAGGQQPAAIEWRHLSSNIRLGGIHAKSQWWHLLEVPKFVGAVVTSLE